MYAIIKSWKEIKSITTKTENGSRDNNTIAVFTKYMKKLCKRKIYLKKVDGRLRTVDNFGRCGYSIELWMCKNGKIYDENK